MHRISRMFEVIQILRAARGPLSAEDLGRRLEVSKRTIYRDIAALQAMRVPIDGEAGIGYVMRRGYDLPPLNFDAEEVEALRVGLLLLSRTGDSSLQRAAGRIIKKIDELQPSEPRFQVSPWGNAPDDPANGCVSIADIRKAVREARKLKLTYRNEDEIETQRVVRPIAVIYHVECVIVAAWCELRCGFRHFRTDRIWACDFLDEAFEEQTQTLHDLWVGQGEAPENYAWVKD